MVRRRFELDGVVEAALGYYRTLGRVFAPASAATQKLLMARVKVPTLALTGANDGCMDTRLYDIGMLPADFPAGLRVERIDGAGHWLHLERPRVIEETITSWLLSAPR